MSLEDIRSECSDVAALLQPYVDGELPNDEQERVAAHMGDCRGCRAAVSEQSWVRAALRGLPREPAPQALRARVLLALDEVDREHAQDPATAAPRPGLWRRVWSRVSDLGRGGLIMVPAGAAAVALFFVVRDASVPAPAPTSAAPVAGIGSALDGIEPRASTPEEDVTSALTELEPQVGFEPQVPGTNSSEDAVQLVGAHLDRSAGNAAARLRFELLRGGRPTGHHLIDRQLPAGSEAPRGHGVSVGGRDYRLDRDEAGTARLHFVVGKVAHTLWLEGSSPRADERTVVDDAGRLAPAEWAPLLRIADRYALAADAPR